MRKTGIVKFFNRDKGFGFIAPEDGSKDVFVHVSTVQRAGVPYLEEGMALSFEVMDDPRGRGQQANKLQLL
jgi:CspA family cold shock protein